MDKKILLVFSFITIILCGISAWVGGEIQNHIARPQVHHSNEKFIELSKKIQILESELLILHISRDSKLGSGSVSQIDGSGSDTEDNLYNETEEKPLPESIQFGFEKIISESEIDTDREFYIERELDDLLENPSFKKFQTHSVNCSTDLCQISLTHEDHFDGDRLQQLLNEDGIFARNLYFRYDEKTGITHIFVSKRGHDLPSSMTAAY